jgi:peroxiredoxin
LRQDYHSFVASGAEVLVIGPESHASFRAYWRSHSLPFVGLADPKKEVSSLYAQPVKLLRLGRMPVAIVVDKSGNIRFRHEGRSMADTVSGERLLGLLDQLEREEEVEPGSRRTSR